jgi:hypothetical protein
LELKQVKNVYEEESESIAVPPSILPAVNHEEINIINLELKQLSAKLNLFCAKTETAQADHAK